FWTERNFLLQLPNVTTSVFIDHGLMDAFGSGHAFQEDDAWGALHKAPKRMLLGDWAHMYPPRSKLDGYAAGANWSAILLPWVDLQLASDSASGVFELSLYDVGPGLSCDPDGVRDATQLTWGAADLRYHSGTYSPRGFPVGQAQVVRVDLWNLARVVPAGHR